jgi:hypothetical protein
MKRKIKTPLLRNPLVKRATRTSKRSMWLSKRRILILIKNQLKTWPLLEKHTVVIEF